MALLIGMTTLTVRKLFFLMVLIATFSMLLTYQIGKYLPRTIEDSEIILVKDSAGVNFGEDGMTQKLYNGGRKSGYNPAGNIVKNTNLYNFQNQRRLALSYKSSQVLSKLTQLEDKLSALSSLTAIVVKDKKENGSHVLSQMLNHLDYRVKEVESQELSGSMNKENWSMLWLVNKGGNSDEVLPKEYQKVNRIKSLQEVVTDSDFPCRAQQTANFVIPDDSKSKVSCNFVQSGMKLDGLPPKTNYNSSAVVIWRAVNSDLNQTVITGNIHNQMFPSAGTLWHIPSGLMVLEGRPVHLCLSLLVTSFLPLRVYLHSNLRTYTYANGHFTRRKDISSVWHMRQTVQQSHGTSAAHSWWSDLHAALLVSLLTAEHNVWNLKRDQNICSCHRCFQTVKVEVVFTSELRPIIIQVTPESVPRDREILEDAVSVTAARGLISTDVAMAMDTVRQEIDFNVQNCVQNFGLCLSEEDLVYFLDNRRETLAPVSFLKLYPSRTSHHYQDMADRFQQLTLLNKVKNLESVVGNSKLLAYKSEQGRSCHPTLDLHSMTSLLENVYMAYDGQSKHVGRKTASKNFVISRKLDADVRNEEMYENGGFNNAGDLYAAEPETKRCSEDAAHIPFLTEIAINQSTMTLTKSNQSASTTLTNNQSTLRMTPDFSPSQVYYMLTVDYNIFVLRILAVAKSCSCEVRFDNLFGSVGSSIYTIGLGENNIRIHVVDVSRVEPRIVNTYTVTVIRRPTGVPSMSPNNRVCSLKQDCSLIYTPHEPCGLQSVRELSSWDLYQKHINNKHHCNTKQVLDAAWYVPCSSCMDASTCNWKSAIWNPNSCHNRHTSQQSLQKCFANKRIMFLGDSTNRGSMHYIIEKINGSLLDWDKTHNLKLYSNINNNQTIMSFAYYPQFWLPTNHRPAFDKAIFQLIKRTLPLENNNNTVMVIGGVHWLGKQHLDFILRALQREQLTNIKLVVKGLGAGFHQQVDGVHFVSSKDQQKLLQREKDISDYGKKMGFHVVETFNMTMARYKDFLPGKCACHFHKVESDHGDGTSKYHITGDINAAYTDQIINHICNFPT